MYTAVTFLALLTIWFWLEGIRQGGVRPWLSVLITLSLAIYTHLLLILLLPLLWVWFFITWPQSKKHWVGFSLVLLFLTLPYAPMVLWQWDLLIVGELSTALPFVPFSEMIEAVLHYQSQGIYATVELIWLLPLILLGMYGLFSGFKAKARRNNSSDLSEWRKYLLLVTWLMVPVITIYIISSIQPVFLPRYIIWISPAAMLVLALGSYLIWQQRNFLLKGAAAAGVGYILIFWLFLGWQQKRTEIKPDLRHAVRYIAERRQPDELLMLQIPHLEFAYRYYSSEQGADPFQGSDTRLGEWVAGPWTNNNLNEADARYQSRRELAAKTEGASEIWIIRSEEDLWDARGFMDEWLTENGALVEEKRFHQTRIQHFRFD